MMRVFWSAHNPLGHTVATHRTRRELKSYLAEIGRPDCTITKRTDSGEGDSWEPVAMDSRGGNWSEGCIVTIHPPDGEPYEVSLTLCGWTWHAYKGGRHAGMLNCERLQFLAALRNGAIQNHGPDVRMVITDWKRADHVYRFEPLPASVEGFEIIHEGNHASR